MSKKILIVDDSKAMRLIIRRTLRQAGLGDLEVEEATNGREALDSIRNQRPAVVLSDWNMPEMNGYELLNAIMDEKLDVKFGFITTEGTAEMRERASAAGALFLIVKPFTPEQFQAALGPVLGKG